MFKEKAQNTGTNNKFTSNSVMEILRCYISGYPWLFMKTNKTIQHFLRPKIVL